MKLPYDGTNSVPQSDVNTSPAGVHSVYLEVVCQCDCAGIRCLLTWNFPLYGLVAPADTPGNGRWTPEASPGHTATGNERRTYTLRAGRQDTCTYHTIPTTWHSKVVAILHKLGSTRKRDAHFHHQPDSIGWLDF